MKTQHSSEVRHVQFTCPAGSAVEESAKLHWLLCLAVIGIVASLMVIVATPWGIGLSPDSGVYIAGARSLIRGAGFSSPTEHGDFVTIVHFPPLYSLALTVPAVFGGDPLQGARWFAALLFACNVILAGALVLAVSRSTLLALMVGLFTVTAMPMVQVHTMAWSEPLFISLQLGSVLALLFYLRNTSRLHLILAAMVSGCGVLVRYAGLATIAAGIISVLLLSQKQSRNRLFDAIIFATIGFVPILAWVVRNAWTAGSLADRSLSIHRVSGEQLASVFRVVLGWQSFFWLTSFDSMSLLLIALALAGTAWFSAAAGRIRYAPSPQGIYIFPAVIFLFIVALGHLVTLFASISFFDAWVPVDTRLLSPLYIPLLVALSLLGAGLRGTLAASRFSVAMVALCLLVSLVGQAAASLNWLQFSYYNGVGYADRAWRNSETLAKLDSLPVAKTIYSNAPDVLYVLRGMPAAMIPRKIDPHTLQPNPRFASEMNRLKSELNENQSVLIYFYRVNWRWYLPGADEVEKSMDMPPLLRERDGLIFRAH